MIAKTFAPQKGVKPFAIMVGAAAARVGVWREGLVLLVV
jgi:hypothetical protein